MNSLYTATIPLHKFKYVGNDIVSLSHKFQYVFEAFMVKHKQQIFLSDIEIDAISKIYSGFYINKAVKRVAEKSNKTVDKETDYMIIKKENHLEQNLMKAVPILNKAKINKLFNDFNQEFKFINIQKDKIIYDINDKSIIKREISKSFRIGFEKQASLINKIGSYRYINNIDKITLFLNNGNKKILVSDVDTDLKFINVRSDIKKILDGLTLPNFINLKKKCEKSLIYCRIHALLKEVNNEKVLGKFVSDKIVKNNIDFINKFEIANEQEKINLIKRYLRASLKFMIDTKVHPKAVTKDINTLILKRVSINKYLMHNIKFAYKQNVPFKYGVKAIGCGEKINNNKIFLNMPYKDFYKIKYNRYFTTKNFQSMYKLHTDRGWFIKTFKSIKVKFTTRKYLNKFYGKMTFYCYSYRRLNEMFLPIIKMQQKVKQFDSTYTQVYKKTMFNFYTKKGKPNVFKLNNTKMIKKGKTELKKVKTSDFFVDRAISTVFKMKKIKFYNSFITIGEKRSNGKFIVGFTKFIFKIKIKKEIALVSKGAYKISYNKGVSSFVHEIKFKASKILLNKSVSKITVVQTKLRTKRLQKTVSEILILQFKLKAKNLVKTYDKISHVLLNLKGLNKTWTEIYKNKNITKLLDLKRRWWILGHDDLTDKLIIPNIDYPYETEPIMGIDKHPISSVSYIDYKDINYGTKEIEVSIRIMQQMLNVLFSVWNVSLKDFNNMTTSEGIEKVMSLFYTWINIAEVEDLMIKKGSREDYLRVYRWFRWEAEKVWIKEQNNIGDTGVKSIGMLVGNIIEYMKIHHYNFVPITNRSRLILMDNMLTVFQVELWDYFKQPNKRKGKRNYMISTVVKGKIKKKLILKI